MPNQVRIGVQTTGVKEASSGVDGLRDKFKKLQSEGAKGVGIGVAAGATTAGLNAIGGAADAAASAVVGFAFDSIKAASDLNESTSKSQVIFGKATAAVDEFASHADKGLGLSKQAALEAAATFGNLFTGLGQSQQSAADMSTKLVTLAGDLASFNNIDPTLALEKLRSGLSGESEPLRSVGVFLTEAKVKAKAMELGLADAHGELSEGAKVMARYQLILDETKTAQGDFARTADGLANSQRVANAELINAQAQIGQKLLPAQLAFTRFMVESGIPAVLALGEAFGHVGEAIGTFVTAGAQVKRTLEDVGNTVPFVAGGFDLLGKAVTLPLQPLFFLKDRIDDFTHAGKVDVPDAAKAASQAAVDFAGSVQGAADDARESGRITRQAFGVIGDSAGTMAKDVKTSFKDMQRAAGLWRHDLLSDAQKVVDDYYTVIIDQDQLAATNAEISAQRRIIASATSSKKEIADAKVRLHELERTQEQLETDLATHGALTGKDYAKTITDLRKRMAGASAAEKKAIEAQIRALQLLALQAKITSGQILTLNERIAVTLAKGGYVSAAGAGAGAQHHASGGRYGAGVPRIVGEQGPELDIPDHAGTIVANNQLGSGGGTSITINIPTTITGMPSPGQVQAWARDAAPALARELQRQGLIPR